MDWDKYFKFVDSILYPDKEPIIEKCKKVYRNYGYNYEQDFLDEYYFMHNTTTGEKVRLYYNGRVIES